MRSSDERVFVRSSDERVFVRSSDVSGEPLQCALEGAVATLTLARPERRNALDTALCEALAAAAASLATDEHVRVVLLRALGPVFCAGADLKERQGMSEDQVRARRFKAFAAYDALERLPMPVVAVVQGPAVGAGCEIAAACDFIVATPEASFRTPEAHWGTVGATQRLPRVLGKRLAKDLMFSGRELGAAAALAAGLVSRIAAAAELEAELAALAARIAAAPPHALRLAKRCIDEGVEHSPRAALAGELLAIEENLARGEWKRTIAGFGEP